MQAYDLREALNEKELELMELKELHAQLQVCKIASASACPNARLRH
jgi:hypothetical protein